MLKELLKEVLKILHYLLVPEEVQEKKDDASKIEPKAESAKDISSEELPEKNTSPYELAEFLKKKKDIVLIDARSREEYEVFHLEGALNVDYTEIEKVEVELKIPKEKQIILYCTMGNRSGYAATTLRKIGYANAVNVMGGVMSYARMLLNNHEIDREKYDDMVRRISGELGASSKKQKTIAIIRIVLGVVLLVIGVLQRKQDPMLIFITIVGLISLVIGLFGYFAKK